MMKKWLFSDNGKITGPFELNESRTLIKKNPSLYAWNPSLTHWVPVNQIEEFELTVDIPKPPIAVPLDMTEKFLNEERELIAQLGTLDDNITLTHTKLSELNKDTEHYQNITTKLNKEVKTVIDNIEKQYAALAQSLADASHTSTSA